MTDKLKDTTAMTCPERLQMIRDYRDHLDATIGCTCDDETDCHVCDLSEAINEICEKISEVVTQYKVKPKTKKEMQRHVPNTTDEKIGKQRMEDHPGVILVGDVIEETPANKITILLLS